MNCPDPYCKKILEPLRCKHYNTLLTNVCLRSSDPFYMVSYYIKWVTTSLSRLILNCSSKHFFPFNSNSRIIDLYQFQRRWLVCRSSKDFKDSIDEHLCIPDGYGNLQGAADERRIRRTGLFRQCYGTYWYSIHSELVFH